MDIATRSRERRQLKPALARAVRIAAQITLTEIAEEIGASPSAVSRWEQGQRRPRGKLADKYAAAIQRLDAEVRRG